MDIDRTRALLAAAAIALLAGGGALAAPPASSGTDAAAPAANSAASDPATGDPATTTGSVAPEPRTRAQQLEDCMAIWEPATHMTKKQWRRTCQNQLDENP